MQYTLWGQGSAEWCGSWEIECEGALAEMVEAQRALQYDGKDYKRMAITRRGQRPDGCNVEMICYAKGKNKEWIRG